jgi:mRNA interferase MazF
MKPGDIILINFPYSDLKSSKLRPALIIATVPGKQADVLIAAISSRRYQAVPDFDELIDRTAPDWESTGLKVTSVIRIAKLASVETNIIAARLGSISLERMTRVH